MSRVSTVLEEAARIAELLPPDIIWSCTVTQDASESFPMSFNIWVGSEQEREAIRRELDLGDKYRPLSWSNENAEEYRYSSRLIVAIIVQGGAYL